MGFLFWPQAVFVSPAKADTDILKAEDGYKKITEMPKDLNNYYFVVVDKDQDLMMTLDKGSNQERNYKTWWYRTSTDPSMDFNKVWTIENNDGANGHTTGYAFRNLKRPDIPHANRMECPVVLQNPRPTPTM